MAVDAPFVVTQMNGPLVFAVITMFAWAGWTIFANFAAKSMRPATVATVSYLVALPVVVGYMHVSGEQISMTTRGVWFGTLAGVCSAVGTVSLYIGLQRGRPSVVTTVSALYFVVAAVVGMLVLGESVTTTKLLGLLFAVAAIALLAIS
ncbi:Uncharacterized membrane protein [Halogranum amylolyticum]|uniref:Uncharacterized membrane protein n=1 Tax=Halogranum amylolyticum TaxID=660520 RepID=A0A1H8MYJ3_9EURY|nr:DMT family transporter [Halogranum amylolyticum]SEO22372.1 Uncharacterized membrane protein [Halogranum amylolyticum]